MRRVFLAWCAALVLSAAPGAAFESLFTFPEPDPAAPLPDAASPGSAPLDRIPAIGAGSAISTARSAAPLPGLSELASLGDPDAGLPALGRLPTPAASPARSAFAATPGSGANDNGLCIRAIREAERRHGLPENILLAIGLQESGREVQGELTIWPWSVNIDGKGHFFDNRAAAQAFVAASQANGKISIDIGCMQINLRWHPQAFANPAQGFDPQANVDYAARFLKELRENATGWIDAAGQYHSATPQYKTLYIAGIERNLQVIEKRAAHFAALAGRDGGPGFATDTVGTLLASAAPQPRRFNPLRAPVRDGAAQTRGYRRSFAPAVQPRNLPQAQPIAALPQPETPAPSGPWWSAEISSAGAARSIYSDQDLAPVIPDYPAFPALISAVGDLPDLEP